MTVIVYVMVAWLLLVSCAIADDYHKRAPSGFTGVRGKKSIIYDPAFEGKDSEAPTEQQFNIVPSGMASETNSLERELGDHHSTWYGSRNPDVTLLKRAPSGFLGMRGKKKNFYNDDYPKRAPSGFLGMRGKKAVFPQLYALPNGEYYNEKRDGMGFVGMRGKKDTGQLEDSKRAPSGFFGMRGKKLAGFFGMRGKKYPYEFRGKFVGVRGKKSSYLANDRTYGYDRLNLEQLKQELDANQLMLLLTEQNESDNSSDWNNNSLNSHQKDKAVSF